MIFNTKAKKALALILALITIASAFALSTFASETVKPFEILEDYCIYSTYKANDGYIGIPVGICTYVKEAKEDSSASATEVVFYVMNYNDLGANKSNEADLPIIYDLIDEGYIVVTLDYYGNELACSPDLTHSIQKIRCGTLSTILGGYSYNNNVKRMVTSGYRIASDIVFYDLTGNAPKGVKESTVKAWNTTGFESAYNKQKTDYVLSHHYEKKTSYDELYKPDGSPIDSRMRLDVIYPSRPTEDIPVLCWASSSETKTANHVKSNRPHDAEGLLRGYAFATYDHGYYPMARGDHYGYFNPYGMQDTVGIHTHAAAVRCVRYFSYLFGYGTENYGGFGHSKSALVASLANPHPENLPETSTFKSYSYYANEEYGDQPYLAYHGSDEVIPSNLQFCYSSMGLGVELHGVNHNTSTAPMFTASGISDEYTQWEFWAEQLYTFNTSGSNFIALSFLDKGHEYVYGTNAVYGFDELALAFDYIDYMLKGAAPEIGYFSTDAIAEVSTDGSVFIQFTGSIPEASVKNHITITDTTADKDVEFTMTSVGNGAKWHLYAKDGFISGHSYTLTVDQALTGSNGLALKEGGSTSFVCAYAPEVISCSADLFGNSIKNYSTVAFQFSAPINAQSLKENCKIICTTTKTVKDSSTGISETTTESTNATPFIELVGDNTLFTVASASSKSEKWKKGATETVGNITTTTSYKYTIIIGANTLATNGQPMGEDYVISFTTK